MAFIDHGSRELSVYIARLTSQDKVLQKLPGDGNVALTAGQMRSCGRYAAVRDPIPLEDDPAGDAHVLICPTPDGAAARTMALQATWVKKPASAPLEAH